MQCKSWKKVWDLYVEHNLAKTDLCRCHAKRWLGWHQPKASPGIYNDSIHCTVSSSSHIISYLCDSWHSSYIAKYGESCFCRMLLHYSTDCSITMTLVQFDWKTIFKVMNPIFLNHEFGQWFYLLNKNNVNITILPKLKTGLVVKPIWFRKMGQIILINYKQ